MKTKCEAILGQEAFVLSATGEVVRTMVGAVGTDGQYTFLNGCRSYCQHWFSFAEAVAGAQDRLKARELALRRELANLRKRRKLLASGEAYELTRQAPLRVVDLQSDESRRMRKLKNVVVPTTYLKPGTRAYVIITPTTIPREFVYRPYSHFVLETIVREVSFSPDGKAHYVFATPFHVDEWFESHKAAESKLATSSEPGTAERIHFVSHAEEKAECDKIEDDVPF